METPGVLIKAKAVQYLGIKPKDALHIACAAVADCDFFITTDKGILKKLDAFEKVRVISPINFINIWEEDR